MGGYAKLTGRGGGGVKVRREPPRTRIASEYSATVLCVRPSFTTEQTYRAAGVCRRSSLIFTMSLYVWGKNTHGQVGEQCHCTVLSVVL